MLGYDDRRYYTPCNYETSRPSTDIIVQAGHVASTLEKVHHINLKILSLPWRNVVGVTDQKGFHACVFNWDIYKRVFMLHGFLRKRILFKDLHHL